MSDTLDLTIDGAEAHILEAALVVYRAQLTDAKALGGPALEAAVLMDGPAARVQAKVHDLMYGTGEIPEPDWDMPESADDLTRAKAAEDLSLGDHHAYPEDFADPNIEGLPAFNGAFNRW